VDNELERELQEHLHRQIDENIENGMTPEEALATGLASFFQKGLVRILARSVLTVYALSGHFGQIRKYSTTALKNFVCDVVGIQNAPLNTMP
jgi:hypothetical protein